MTVYVQYVRQRQTWIVYLSLLLMLAAAGVLISRDRWVGAGIWVALALLIVMLRWGPTGRDRS